MSSKTDGCSTYIALVLAATAAIMSAPHTANDTYHVLHFLLSTAAPEVDTVTGAIGDGSRDFVAP